MKDTSQRRIWLAEIGELRAEIDAHIPMMESIRNMGRKLLLDENSPLDYQNTEQMVSKYGRSNVDLRKRLESLESGWQKLLNVSVLIRFLLEIVYQYEYRLS